jgi:hypothetical protein
MSTKYFNLWIYSGTIFIGILFCAYIGFKTGKRDKSDGASVAINGAVFGLLGLILAFSFSGASERFKYRRELITQEANAVGIAYSRLDLLQNQDQATLRTLMQQYLQSRLYAYQVAAGSPAAEAAHTNSIDLQEKVWSKAILAAQKTGNQATLSLVSQSLNAMFDSITTRRAATRDHPPVIVGIMLVALTWMSAFLVGYDMVNYVRIPWVQIVIFASAMTMMIFVIRDIEYPHLGFIRVDAADKILVEALHGMKTSANH